MHRENKRGDVISGRLDKTAERIITSDVDFLQKALEVLVLGGGGITGQVGKIPQLMAGAMRCRKADEEKVPSLSAQKLQG
jgi:hypothetical protein